MSALKYKKYTLIQDIKHQIVNQQAILKLIFQRHYHLRVIPVFILTTLLAVIVGRV